MSEVKFFQHVSHLSLLHTLRGYMSCVPMLKYLWESALREQPLPVAPIHSGMKNSLYPFSKNPIPTLYSFTVKLPNKRGTVNSPMHVRVFTCCFSDHDRCALILTFCRPPYGDFSPGNLAKVTDSIQFNLFDEIIVDLLQVLRCLEK